MMWNKSPELQDTSKLHEAIGGVKVTGLHSTDLIGARRNRKGTKLLAARPIRAAAVTLQDVCWVYTLSYKLLYLIFVFIAFISHAFPTFLSIYLS